MRRAHHLALLALTAACSGGVEPPSSPTGAPVPAFAQIQSGSGYTCALTEAGAAWCWGINAWGRLGAEGEGIALDEEVFFPTPVAGALRFGTLSTGAEHTCAVTLEQAAYCWGLAYRGSLGNGEVLEGARPAPLPVAGGFLFQEIAAGFAHSCGVTTSGLGLCWGPNSGELGTGDFDFRITPTPVVGDIEFRTISTRTGSSGGSAQNSCGLAVSGAAWCWGTNGAGSLGDGSTVDRSLVPVSVAGDRSYADLSASGGYVCAVTPAGELYCWGRGARVPTLLGDGIQWATVSVGSTHSCAISVSAALYCWGSNEFGQLGLGGPSTAVATEPTLVPGDQVWRQGHGSYGELGTGELPPHSLPYTVRSPARVAATHPVD